MDVLALDFDGVIFDSAREAFAVAVKAYAETSPGSRLASHPLAAAGAGLPAGYRFDRDPVFRRFMELVPLGNRAEDFGVILGSIEQGLAITSQADYDATRAGREERWLRDYHELFYVHRKRFRTRSPAQWRALQDPYPELVRLLRRRADSVELAILTARDAASVNELLREHGLERLFPPERIYDKETGVSKRAHLRRLRDDLGVEPGRITFVDDKLNHLLAASREGVRAVLAGWGHNTPREHADARRLGFDVASLDTAEELLFGDRAVPGQP